MPIDPGPLPELKWLKKDVFVVDHHYQRHTNSQRSQQVIENIYKNFLWARFSPPTVTPGPKGKFLVIDGQHRITAVQGRADIDTIPCYVVPDLSLEDQARNFVAINRDRAGLHALAMHRALLTMGDETSLKIQEVCDEAEVSIALQPAPYGMTPPRVTAALGTIKSGLSQHGEECVIAALMVLADSYKIAKGMMRSKTLKALMRFYSVIGIKNVDRDALIYVLKEVNPIDLEEEAMSNARADGESVQFHILKDIRDRYDLRLQGVKS
ncbi:DUF6551 family protein [Micavibrio aeruginosavorus]|uniref:DUF6551 family protein n=1 Tax=Micavibrio aeruginosavorus TaxID=349221 RepID=UPI003F4A987F